MLVTKDCVSCAMFALAADLLRGKCTACQAGTVRTRESHKPSWFQRPISYEALRQQRAVVSRVPLRIDAFNEERGGPTRNEATLVAPDPGADVAARPRKMTPHG